MCQRKILEPSWGGLQKAFWCSNESKNSSYKMNLKCICWHPWNLKPSSFCLIYWSLDVTGPTILPKFQPGWRHDLPIHLDRQFRASAWLFCTAQLNRVMAIYQLPDWVCWLKIGSGSSSPCCSCWKSDAHRLLESFKVPAPSQCNIFQSISLTVEYKEDSKLYGKNK